MALFLIEKNGAGLPVNHNIEQGMKKMKDKSQREPVRAGKVDRTTLHLGLSSVGGEGRLCGIRCHKSHTTVSAERK